MLIILINRFLRFRFVSKIIVILVRIIFDIDWVRFLYRIQSGFMYNNIHWNDFSLIFSYFSSFYAAISIIPHFAHANFSFNNRISKNGPFYVWQPSLVILQDTKTIKLWSSPDRRLTLPSSRADRSVILHQTD